MIIGHCRICGRDGVALTNDHMLPKWLYKRMHILLGKGFKKNLGQKNIEKICSPCNFKKAGYIDYKNPMVQEIMKSLADKIYREIKYAKKHEAQQSISTRRATALPLRVFVHRMWEQWKQSWGA